MNENKTKKALINYYLQRYRVFSSGSFTCEYRKDRDENSEIRFLLLEGEIYGN